MRGRDESPFFILFQKPFLIWLQATRPQFFTVMLFPILLGTSLAWHAHHQFLPIYFGLSLLAGLLSHAGINVLNDYFDKAADHLNTTPLTPFAGGSRMIQQGILTAQETYQYGLILLLMAVILGLWLVWMRGWPLLWIGMLGLFSGYFYSAPPLSLNNRGLGEILVGLNFGVLTTLGAYYVQTQTLSIQVVIAALPITFLVTAILYLNEFPDYLADQQAGKQTWVVRLGRPAARHLYTVLITASFLSIMGGVITHQLPPLALAGLSAVPIGWLANQKLASYYDQPFALLPAIKSTILLHTLISLILIWVFLY